MARRLDDVRPAEVGRHVQQCHDVLQLITKSKGAAGLVIASAPPESPDDNLIEEPTVEHEIERGLGSLYGPRPEQAIPMQLDLCPSGLHILRVSIAMNEV